MAGVHVASQFPFNMPSRLTEMIFWFSAICCALAQAAILRSVVVAPVHAHDDAAPRGRRGADIVWAVLPGIALVLVFVFTWRVMHGTRIVPPAPGATR